MSGGADDEREEKEHEYVPPAPWWKSTSFDEEKARAYPRSISHQPPMPSRAPVTLESLDIYTDDAALAYAIALSEGTVATIDDRMAADVAAFTDEHCPWCYATYAECDDGDDYAPTFHGDDGCMGPCRKCLHSLPRPIACKRCGAAL